MRGDKAPLVTAGERSARLLLSRSVLNGRRGVSWASSDAVLNIGPCKITVKNWQAIIPNRFPQLMPMYAPATQNPKNDTIQQVCDIRLHVGVVHIIKQLNKVLHFQALN